MRRHENGNGGGALTTPSVPPLQMGDKLNREDFLRIWEQHPEIKRAELIGGIVYMPSPVAREHGREDNLASTWIGVYHAETPGTEAGNNTTTLMLDESPQPDVYLRILPEYGGRSSNEGKYVSGGPELITEVCASSSAYDLHQKLDLYEKAGVLEYLAILLYEQEIRWHRLGKLGYRILSPANDNLWKSKVFPGLWLDGKAILANDAARVLKTLRLGLESPEHAAFVERLAKRQKRNAGPQ